MPLQLPLRERLLRRRHDQLGRHHLDITQWALDADTSGPLEVEGRGKRNPTGLHDAFYDVEVNFTYADGVEVRCSAAMKRERDASV